MEISGPGSFRMQGVYTNCGGVPASFLIDHPQADFLMVGGNLRRNSQSESLPLDQLFHVRQRQGRVRIVGTGTQRAGGVADFRIDRASLLGAHAIVNVRSEGSAPGSLHPGALLFVPPSAEAVDVLLMNNAHAGTAPTWDAGHLVDYNAAGVVWLIGNNGPWTARHLAIGDAPESTIVAAGNRSYALSDLLPIHARLKIAFGNVYSHRWWTGEQVGSLDHRWLTGDPVLPAARFVDPAATPPDSMPAVPLVEIPPPIGRPIMTAALPGMLDVRRDFGAAGDGVTDDTPAIQAAFDSDRHVYFPAGRYRIRRELGFVHSAYAQDLGVRHGGWIAGAGSDRTFLVRDSADKGGVFVSEGIGYATIQGISFETARWDPKDPDAIRETNVSLENNPSVGFATGHIGFYDCRFLGGRHGIGFGLHSPTNCETTLLVDCEFAGAQTGLAVGSFNALNLIVYSGVFRNNDITMGHPEPDPKEDYLSGGTWTVLHATVRGTRTRDFNFVSSSEGVWYFHGLNSDTPRVVHRPSGQTSAPFHILFDQCDLRPRTPVDFAFDFPTGGGLIFLRSTVLDASLRLGSLMSVSFAMRLYGWFPSLSGSETGPINQVFEFGPPSLNPTAGE
ncbi:MAG: hypothetical protein HYY17_03145 [Planctomycetes bacterium]|nr:hypothetical protein [Planctomycetota bacterium]